MKKHEKENGSFKCLTCSKVFSKQTNASQHSKSCSTRTSKKHKVELVCKVCKKNFQYKSLLNRHIKSHERPDSSFANRQFDNSISDELFIPSQVYVSSHSQLNENDQVIPDDDTCADFSLSSLNITENTVEICNETVEEVEETTIEVNEIAEVNETIQDKNKVDKEVQEASKTDDRKHYYQQYRERHRNIKSLEEVVNKLSSPQKQKVKQSLFKTSRSFELIVCDASLAHLKSLWEKCDFPAFRKFLFDMFTNNVENDDFVKWLSKNLKIRTHRLRDGIIKYKNNIFKETRGREKCKDRHVVYDAWVENSIPSTDCRNGRSKVTISKRRYLPFSDLTNQEVVIKENANK